LTCQVDGRRPGLAEAANGQVPHGQGQRRRRCPRHRRQSTALWKGRRRRQRAQMLPGEDVIFQRLGASRWRRPRPSSPATIPLSERAAPNGWNHPRHPRQHDRAERPAL